MKVGAKVRESDRKEGPLGLDVCRLAAGLVGRNGTMSSNSPKTAKMLTLADPYVTRFVGASQKIHTTY